MKQTSTKVWVPKKCLVLLLTFLGLSFSQSLFAHTVDGYTSACTSTPTYSIDPTVSNVNSSSNYGWQYRNSAGAWICLVNGTNVINGVSFTVSGALSTLTTNPAPIVFQNPTIELNGVVIRCIISDGNGVNPCSMPSGNTYNSGSGSVNFTINVSNTPCGSNRFCQSCALGYPDNSNPPRSQVTFSENDILRAYSPNGNTCGQAVTAIKLWYNDEHAMLLGTRSVTVKRANGTTYTTNYPISAYPGTPTCISNPSMGTTITSGAQAGVDVAAGGGRPIWPALFLTDLTVNGPTSRAGDWQQGGTGIKPTSVCGSWKGSTKFVDSTKTPVAVTITCDPDPAKNDWNLAGGEAPPVGTSNEGYGTLVKWDLASLNLIPGHDYRIQIMVHDGDQNKNGGDAGSACTFMVSAPQMYPDFNVTYVNVPVPGNVSTNDVVPAGTLYGTSPTLTASPAGSHPSITMNNDGTYSFVSDVVGVYLYKVPVCVPGGASPCPTTLLTITVLGPTVTNNPPVANTDIASTKLNTPVTLNTLSNDKAGNPGGSLVPGSVTVTVAPLHGTVTVNAANGNTTYTPAAGFTGKDTLTYRVCDNSTPSLCATALQIITVWASGSGNSTLAADDYVYTPINIAVSGNAKLNDTDPEGNTQTITAQTTTAAGKGTLVLAADGSFTFTPVAGFTGPVNFPYTTTDNGTPVATAKATIYVLVSPELPAMYPDFNVTYVDVHVPGNVNTNDKVPSGTMYGTAPTLISSPAASVATITMASSGVYDFVANKVGVYVYKVPVCVPGQTSGCPTTLLTITVLCSSCNNNPPVANTDIATTKINTPVTLKTLINDKPGNVGGSLVPSSVTVVVAANHGTSSINLATGDNTYTPAAGFTGLDTLTYRVSDNNGLTATAIQIISVRPLTSANITLAADDYAFTPINTAVSGNAKTNDTDPEGNTQTITAQNVTVAGKGNMVLNSDGTFTFTPFAGFSGPVNFPYTTTDNGTPVATASATIYILVSPGAQLPDLTPAIFNDGTTVIQNTTRDNVIRIFNIGAGPTSAPVIFTIPKMEPAFLITINPNETSMNVFGGTEVSNADWIITEQPSRYVFTSKPGIVIPAGGYKDIGLKVTPISIKNSTGNLSVQIVFGTGGGETPYNNNTDNNTYSTN